MLPIGVITALSFSLSFFACTGALAQAAPRSGQVVVDLRCATCHAAGLYGAPKMGDRKAWVPRMSKGLDSAVAAAISGTARMPPRGGLPEATDGELRAAIVYMFNYGQPWNALAAYRPRHTGGL